MIVFYEEWMYYVRTKYRTSLEWTLLEIKLPKEINKTPLAMEIALGALHQGVASNWYTKYIQGVVKGWFSLEMVSIEGNIKFFIFTPAKLKKLIETQFYAQYPDIEILEVPDYTRYIDFKGNAGEWDVFGTQYELTKPDPLPIRTYIDYGMDKAEVEEQFKIDPLNSVLEYLGSMGKGEQLWIQILVQQANDRYFKEGEMKKWQDHAKDLVTEMAGRGKKDKEGKPIQSPMPTKGESEAIEAIERHAGKLGFDCGIRALYIAKKDKFSYGNIQPLGGLFRAFSNANSNSFKTSGSTYGYDFEWQRHISFDRFIFIPEFFADSMERINGARKAQFDAYKHRSWFYPPAKRKPFLLTSEELATIFHFPGGVAQTPTFGRIPSKKSEAPVNLPV